MVVCLDIETASRPDWLIKQAPPELHPEERAVWTVEHAADGATSPTSGQVVCWAIACSRWEDGELVDGPVRSQVTGAGVERDLLSFLLDTLLELKPKQFVAHNGSVFDYPFLRFRALAVGLPRLARAVWSAKPWDDRLIDTADPSWSPRPGRPTKGWEYSLDALADMLGIERPPTLPGSQVPAAWYRGELEAIRTHCVDDVLTLRRVHRRLLEGRIG